MSSISWQVLPLFFNSTQNVYKLIVLSTFTIKTYKLIKKMQFPIYYE